jgi:16S rRNA (adenine1518-N6/adenine1519-N6)-dimethyltransferase
MKKSLGQNFFVNKNLAVQITNTVLSEKPDILVEIGPGTGSFTQIFAEEKLNIVAIEKDDTLAKDLKKSFPEIDVQNFDFLEWNLQKLENFKQKRVVFFGSLPYNASKPIIRKIITSEFFRLPSYFIIQKEVAEKYTLKGDSYNQLSLYTSLFADVKKLFDISGDSFKPKPKVTSSFVKFSPNKKVVIDYVSFEKFLWTCFGQPRKTLKNNLKQRTFEKTKLLESLLSKRPQHLSLDEYLYLFDNLR